MDKFIFAIVVLGAYAIGILVGISIASTSTIEKPAQETASTIEPLYIPGHTLVLYGPDGRFWVSRDGGKTYENKNLFK